MERVEVLRGPGLSEKAEKGYLNEIASCALFTKVVDFCGYRIAAL